MAMRVSRYSIPKVNPNPRPPNEPRYNRNGGTTAPRGSGRTTAVGGAQTAYDPHKGVGAGKGFPSRQRPGERGSAQPSSAPSAPPSLAPPIDPRDSQYWKDVAQLKFENDIALQNFDVEDAFAKSAFDKEKAARDYAKPLEVQRLREGANVGGRIYSTATQEDLGNLAQEQFAKDSQLAEAYQYALAQRIGQRGETKSNFERAMAELLEGATERQAAGEIERPSLADEGGANSPAVKAMEDRAKKGKKSQKKFQRNTPIGGKGPKGGSTGRGGGTNAPRGSNATTNVNAAKVAQKKKKK